MKRTDSTWHKDLRPALLVALLFALADRAAADDGFFVVKDLGVLTGDTSSVAFGLNQFGDVVGMSTGAAGTYAFLYIEGKGMTALPGLPNRQHTLARDINDLGEVVGNASAGGVDPGHAVLWSGGKIQDLGTLGTGYYSDAWAINNNGTVVGSSYTNGGGFGVHAFLVTPGSQMMDLTPNSDTGAALDINDAGQVTGYKTAAGGVYHAFRWQKGSFEDLGVLPGFAYSFGWAINRAGQVAGSSSSASGSSERMIRSIEGGGLLNLGGTGEHNVALGINASGSVVGYAGNSGKRGRLYTDAYGLQDLNTLIDPSLGWVILAANDINDAGQIAGYAFNNVSGLTHAVRLDPVSSVPECSVDCLRSTDITLRLVRQSGRPVVGKVTLSGKVTVQDENKIPMPNALVVATWTLPNGTQVAQSAFTGRLGIASFTTGGPRLGTYTLDVVNIILSGHTFNPSESVLSKSITLK